MGAENLGDYDNNRRIKAKRKGLLPAIHRQQALWAAEINLLGKYCLTFCQTASYAYSVMVKGTFATDIPLKYRYST